MGIKERKILISDLEKDRKSKVIVYITSERQPLNLFPTSIALDALELFYEHLQKIGKTNKISLCICSNGGNLDTPWPLVNLIREYCSVFEVLVPYKALSAATLISLGANKVVMAPISQLSPIDPEGHYEKDGKKYKISVEDINGYIDFAKEKVGVSEQTALSEVLGALTNEIGASILGSINRTHSLIRRLAKNLLRLHLKESVHDRRINDIVEHLAQKLFSHQHYINRREAKEIVGFGNIIEMAKSETAGLLTTFLNLYYYEELKTKEVFNAAEILGTGKSKSYKANRAFIESEKLSHCFRSDMVLSKRDGAKNINIDVTSLGWEEE